MEILKFLEEIKKQNRKFKLIDKESFRKYRGKFVAFYNGNVLISDNEETNLRKKIMKDDSIPSTVLIKRIKLNEQKQKNQAISLHTPFFD